jgi:phosphoenolpyruvate carboxylase
MVASLVDNLDGQRTPGEAAADAARFRMALTASWQTTDSSPVRPTVDDEREHVGFYLVQVLYRVIPVLYESLQQALLDTYGEDLPLPRLLRFGTWVGGDMDGNPNVDAGTIRHTLDAQRQAVLGRYQKDLLQLASLLSQSTERIAVSDALQARVAHYAQLLPQVKSRPRHADMPYRLLNDRMRARVQATLDDADGAYASPDELEHDIQLILDSLHANKGDHAGGFAVRRLLWRVRTFGFHLARLDVRQESSVHGRALASVLDGQEAWDAADAVTRAARLAPFASGEQALPPSTEEGGQRLDAVFAALADARRRHGADALGSYIISMAHDRSDVLAVLALARRGGLVDDAGAVPLEIAPLF